MSCFRIPSLNCDSRSKTIFYKDEIFFKGRVKDTLHAGATTDSNLSRRLGSTIITRSKNNNSIKSAEEMGRGRSTKRAPADTESNTRPFRGSLPDILLEPNQLISRLIVELYIAGRRPRRSCPTSCRCTEAAVAAIPGRQFYFS